MSDRLEQQLNELKNKPQAGAVDSAWLSKNKALLMMQVKNTMPAPAVEPVKQLAGTVESYKQRWFAPQNRGFAFAMRPVMVVALAIIIPFGSWISTVSAARLSVPGEALYGVKIITEKVQITLAPSPSSKISLHTEFAARRADEVVKLKAKPAATAEAEEEIQDFIKETIERLKVEITAVNSELTEMSESEGAEDVREAARTVDVKTEEIGRVLKNSDVLAIDNPEIEGVKELVDEASVNAVEIIVKTVSTEEIVEGEEVIIEEGVEAINEEIKSSLEDKLKAAASEIDDVVLALEAASNTNTPRAVAALEDFALVQEQIDEALAVVKEAGESVDSESFEEAIEKVKEATAAVNDAENEVAKIQEATQQTVEVEVVLEEEVDTEAENTTTTEKIIEEEGTEVTETTEEAEEVVENTETVPEAE